MTHSELKYINFHFRFTSNPLYFGGTNRHVGGGGFRLWGCFAAIKKVNSIMKKEDYAQILQEND